MKQIAIAIWALLAGYCLLCVWLRELRFAYWRGSGVKIGTVGYIGFALFFWSPALAILQLISEPFLVYLLMLAAFVVSIIGYFVDVKKL